jgi:hypothetical protein
VLAKFGGIPKVSDSGNIIYVFPTMRTRSTVSSYALVPEKFEQKPWKFSYLTKEKMVPVVALAMTTLAGSSLLVIIFGIAHRPLLPLFSFFWFYSLLFLLIPNVRWVILRILNRQIRQSNARANQYELRLGSPSPELMVKLEEAERIRHAEPQPVPGEVIYTTAKDLLEQAIEQEL